MEKQALKELLKSIKNNDYAVPEGVNPYELSLVMMENIGDIDSELRDDLILYNLFKWINEGILSVSVKVLAPLIIPRIVLKYPSKARICFTRINLFFIFNFHIFRNLIIPRHKIL
ncbi:hypothetical protein [Haloimpatiens lingqiaonensis]|uniref:hypothetical protein n=1 Tax=Haloimpatiens lingqiaonensis TaxID=1380675 RepID=UPI0010FE5CFF|nr:hypothetical protein [Haloimpatiens lingqiaonensis]